MHDAVVSLEPLTNALLQLAGMVILALGSWAVGRLVQWLGLKNAQQASANFDVALEKAVTFGVQQTQDLIRREGWDSAEVKNETLRVALPYMIDRFADTLKAAGADLSKPDQINERVRDALDRAFPNAAGKAAASPATPPSTAPNPSSVSDLPRQSK